MSPFPAVVEPDVPEKNPFPRSSSYGRRVLDGIELNHRPFPTGRSGQPVRKVNEVLVFDGTAAISVVSRL
jgi:hypothetical protein